MAPTNNSGGGGGGGGGGWSNESSVDLVKKVNENLDKLRYKAKTSKNYRDDVVLKATISLRTLLEFVKTNINSNEFLKFSRNLKSMITTNPSVYLFLQPSFEALLQNIRGKYPENSALVVEIDSLLSSFKNAEEDDDGLGDFFEEENTLYLGTLDWDIWDWGEHKINETFVASMRSALEFILSLDPNNGLNDINETHLEIRLIIRYISNHSFTDGVSGVAIVSERRIASFFQIVMNKLRSYVISRNRNYYIHMIYLLGFLLACFLDRVKHSERELEQKQIASLQELLGSIGSILSNYSSLYPQLTNFLPNLSLPTEGGASYDVPDDSDRSCEDEGKGELGECGLGK